MYVSTIQFLTSKLVLNNYCQYYCWLWFSSLQSILRKNLQWQKNKVYTIVDWADIFIFTKHFKKEQRQENKVPTVTLSTDKLLLIIYI